MWLDINRKKLLVIGLMMPAIVWATPQIKEASAALSSSSVFERLTISYTICDPKLKSTGTCRYAVLHLFESRVDAEVWSQKNRANYQGPVRKYEKWMWTFQEDDDVLDGKHTLILDLEDEFDMTAREFLQSYPEAHVLAAVYDMCASTYSYKIVPVGFTKSPVSDFSKALYAKSQTFTGICMSEYEDGIYGTVTLQASKINAKTGIVKVTGTIAPFASTKKLTATANLVPDVHGAIYGVLSFKAPVFDVNLTIYGDVFEDSRGRTQTELMFEGISTDGFEIYSADIGGAIEYDTLYFSVQMDEAPDFGEDFDLIAEPIDEPIYIDRGTKMSFRKAPVLSIRKNGLGSNAWYEVYGLDDESMPNVCGVKLSYASKTGVLKGFYNLYASNLGNTTRRPTLKKVKVSVTGVMVDGIGYGMATAKYGKKSYSWPVSISPERSMCVIPD